MGQGKYSSKNSNYNHDGGVHKRLCTFPSIRCDRCRSHSVPRVPFDSIEFPENAPSYISSLVTSAHCSRGNKTGEIRGDRGVKKNTFNKRSRFPNTHSISMFH